VEINLLQNNSQVANFFFEGTNSKWVFPVFFFHISTERSLVPESSWYTLAKCVLHFFTTKMKYLFVLKNTTCICNVKEISMSIEKKTIYYFLMHICM
jgi:hypothetical protein